MRLNFNHLQKYEFKHGFSDSINPICVCGTEVEATEHVLLLCHFYSMQRFELLENLEKAESDFENLSDRDQVSFMWHGSKTNTSEIFNQKDFN